MFRYLCSPLCPEQPKEIDIVHDLDAVLMTKVDHAGRVKVAIHGTEYIRAAFYSRENYGIIIWIVQHNGLMHHGHHDVGAARNNPMCSTISSSDSR